MSIEDNLLVVFALAVLSAMVACSEEHGGPAAGMDDDDATAAGDDDTTGQPPGGDDDDGGPDDDDSAGPSPPCDRYDTFGSFTLSRPPDLDHGFTGVFREGPDPLLLDELLTEGDCAFYDFDPFPFCDPPCVPPDVCGFGGECRPYPGALDIGTVSVAGTTPPIEVDLHAGLYYASTTHAPDLYQPGDALTLSATGGSGVEPFEISALGVPSLVPAQTLVTLVRHGDVELSWQPEPVPAGARVRVWMYIHHHALYQAYLQCEVDDSDGTLTIPASIVDALLDASWGGEPNDIEGARMMRLSRSVERTPLGCVEFASVSAHYLTADVEIPDPVNGTRSP